MGKMTQTELADLDRSLAEGPCLVNDAVMGACVGILIGWFGYDGSQKRHVFVDGMQGAVAGAAVSLVTYGISQWISAKEHERERLSTGSFRAGFAPFPFYRASVTYPWSNH